jgi:uncharacterized protein (DUF488 family)
MEPLVIYTVGHSTRSPEELIALLKEPSVLELVDVRSVPRSRRHPHFNAAAIAERLRAEEIGYTHEAGLGGFRRPRPDSPNRGWTQPAFVGYADHMATSEFANALERVQKLARTRRACLMCAEAQWWRCHRRLISDALLVRGWTVLHLGLTGAPVAHELTPFAVREGRSGLTYPPLQGELGLDGGARADAPAGGDV